MHAGPARRRLGRFAEVYAVEQRVEQPLIELNVPRAFRGLRNPKNSTIQTLLEDTHPGAVEKQQLLELGSLGFRRCTSWSSAAAISAATAMGMSPWATPQAGGPYRA